MKQTEEWFKAAIEYFDDAIETKNVEQAKDIIGDVIDAGNLELARSMNRELRKMSESQNSQ